MYEMISLIWSLIGVVIFLLGFIDCFLGVLLIIQKKGYVRHLGIFLLLSGLVAIYSNSSFLFARKGLQVYVIYSYLGILAGFIQIAATIFLFLFARKRYNSEGLAVVVALPIVWLFLHKVVQVILLKSNLGLSLSENQLLFSSYAALSNLALIAILIYIAVIYYRNKNQEQVFPSIWIFPVIFAISYMLNSVANIAAVSESAAMAVILLRLITAVVYPAFGFYLIVNMNSSAEYIDSQNV